MDATKGKKDAENARVGIRLPPEYYGPEGIELIKEYWNYEDDRAKVLHDKMDEVIKGLKSIASGPVGSGRIPDIVQAEFLDSPEEVKVSHDAGDSKALQELLRSQSTTNKT